MKYTFKKILASVLVATIVFSFGSALATDEGQVTATENTSTAKTETTGTSSKDDDKETDSFKTEAEALAAMQKVSETDKLELWFNEETVHFAVKVKASGYIWWSEPYDADYDTTAKVTQLQELKSSFTVTHNRNTSTSLNSYIECVTRKNGFTVDKIDGGVRVTYKFKQMYSFTIPVEYKLVDDHFEATIVGKDIKEERKDYKDSEGQDASYMMTSIALLPNFGSGDTNDKGYMVVPDGSGAVINYNNGKNTYSKYSAPVYGRDYADVLIKKESDRQQVYMPVIGIVNNGNALLAVCTEGAERANINAYVSGQNNTSYNSAYFSFTLRAKDTYYVAGDLQQGLDMYESRKGAFENYSVSYYPVKEGNATYNDIAARYRQYLTEDVGVKKITKANDDTVYLTVYGGTFKETSILGIPAKVKTAATTYDQAKKILEELIAEGVNDIVVNYVDWNDDAISKIICTDANYAGKLGGKSDFNKLKKFADENGIKIYYDMEVSEFAKTGNGFNTLFDAAASLTKSFARQTEFDLSWGIEAENKSNWSILAPQELTKVFGKITKSFKKNDITGVSLGSISSALYSDFGKGGALRTEMSGIVADGYAKMRTEVGSVLANTANQYVWSNVDCITNLPLYSSKYDIFDYDIPLLQMSLHGLIPYSTESINACADMDELFDLAVVTGSNLGYDFLYVANKKLQNTEYNKYYYANFDGWAETVGGQYKLVSDVIKGLSDQTLDKYEVIDKNTVRSTFSNGTTIEVNKDTNEIKVNGKKVNYADYNL